MDEEHKDKFEEYEEKTRVSFGLYLATGAIEILIFFLAILIASDLFTIGSVHLYLLIWGDMLLLWSQLQDGKLTMRGQVVMFAIVPYLVFFLIRLLAISNWCGVVFLIIYSIVLCVLFDIKMNDGGSSTGNSTSGKIVGKIIGSTLRDLTKTSRRKRRR